MRPLTELTEWRIYGTRGIPGANPFGIVPRLHLRVLQHKIGL